MSGDKEEIVKGLHSLFRHLDSLQGRVHTASPHGDSRGTTLPPGCHIHEDWEIKIVSGGRLLYESPNERFHVPDGHILLTPPHVVHIEYRHGSEFLAKNAKYFYMGQRYHNSYEVGFQYSSAYVFYTLSSKETDELAELTGLPLAAIFKRVAWPEKENEDDPYTLCLLKLLLSALLRVLAQSPAEPLSTTDLTLNRVNSIIERSYHNHDITVEEIAGEVGLTSGYLTTLYKKHHKRSLWQAIMDMRLEKAEQLLRRNKFSMKEVAYLSGWQNPLYFSKVFHRKFGVSPSRYRMDHIGESSEAPSGG